MRQPQTDLIRLPPSRCPPKEGAVLALALLAVLSAQNLIAQQTQISSFQPGQCVCAMNFCVAAGVLCKHCKFWPNLFALQHAMTEQIQRKLRTSTLCQIEIWLFVRISIEWFILKLPFASHGIRILYVCVSVCVCAMRTPFVIFWCFLLFFQMSDDLKFIANKICRIIECQKRQVFGQSHCLTIENITCQVRHSFHKNLCCEYGLRLTARHSEKKHKIKYTFQCE